MGNVPLRTHAGDAAPPTACAPLVDRHAWPAHTERFTETKPVTIPKVFHGCETHDGVHTCTRHHTSSSSSSMQHAHTGPTGRATPVHFRRCPIRRAAMPWRRPQENLR